MTDEFIARQSIVINATVAKVWDDLMNPDTIKQFMFAREHSEKNRGMMLANLKKLLEG